MEEVDEADIQLKPNRGNSPMLEHSSANSSNVDHSHQSATICQKHDADYRGQFCLQADSDQLDHVVCETVSKAKEEKYVNGGNGDFSHEAAEMFQEKFENGDCDGTQDSCIDDCKLSVPAMPETDSEAMSTTRKDKNASMSNSMEAVSVEFEPTANSTVESTMESHTQESSTDEANCQEQVEPTFVSSFGEASISATNTTEVTVDKSMPQETDCEQSVHERRMNTEVADNTETLKPVSADLQQDVSSTDSDKVGDISTPHKMHVDKTTKADLLPENSLAEKSLPVTEKATSDLMADAATSPTATLSCKASAVNTSISVNALLPAPSVSAASTIVLSPFVQQPAKTLAISRPLSMPAQLAPRGTRSLQTQTITSKLLQDVGLLIVSQRVFRDLASIQKQKITKDESGTANEADLQLLQKLRTSYQNLASKNAGFVLNEQKCWCGYRSESENILEAHRLECGFSTNCCFCENKQIFQSRTSLKRHLWVAHNKIGYLTDNSGFPCSFCQLDFKSQIFLLKHTPRCQPYFRLATNLVPSSNEMDIPVFRSITPKTVQTIAPLPTAPLPHSSGNLSVSASSTVPSVVASPVAVQMVQGPASTTQASGKQLIQIGKQLYTVFPPASAAGLKPSMGAGSVLQALAVAASDSTASTSTTVPISAMSGVVLSNMSSRMMNSASTGLPSTAAPVPLPCTVCPICKAFVSSESALQMHISVVHHGNKFRCSECSNPPAFRTEQELSSHVLQCHTMQCWMCTSYFQPPALLVNHIAEVHNISISRMLSLRRCYLCSLLPSMKDYAAFEEHMLGSHSVLFPNLTKLWESIIKARDTVKDWYARQHADGTYECPRCHCHFVSRTFVFRHFYLTHDGRLVRFQKCPNCTKCMPSNAVAMHRAAEHTKTCSVLLSNLGMDGTRSVLLPPPGTRLLGKRSLTVTQMSCVQTPKELADTVVISDDDDGQIVEKRPKVQLRPEAKKPALVAARKNRHDSSMDDVNEVLESIVSPSMPSDTPLRLVHVRKPIVRPVQHTSALQPCNGISDDEVEMIESIVPSLQSRHRRPEPCQEAAAGAHNNGIHKVAVGLSGTAIPRFTDSAVSEKNDVDLMMTSDDDAAENSQPAEATSDRSAQKLMDRDQITMDNVEEVLEIDGETVLIVHDEDDDKDNDDDGGVGDNDSIDSS